MNRSLFASVVTLAVAATGLVAAPANGGATAADIADPDGVSGFVWERERPSPSPPAQVGQMVYDSDRDMTVLLNGQTHQFGDEQETWVWDGTSWSQLDIPQPPRRAGAGMAYDRARQEVVLFGGVDPDDESGLLGDTWVFDGAAWTERTPDDSPPPGLGMETAYDPVRQEVVMLTDGELRPNRPDTWVWNGDTWERRQPAFTPRALGGFSMAWDESRQAVVMYGGSRRDQQHLHRTWAWDGVTWTRVHTRTEPTPSVGTSMASTSRGVVLFGGSDGPLYDETWVLRAHTWKLVALDGGPKARWGATMAYDSQRDQVVLFGGNTETETFGDMWLLNRT